MESIEEWDKDIKKITGLFEQKISSFISEGIPALLIEEALLILYFDSIRITADNASITHQVNKSRQVLKPLLIMILLNLSKELEGTISIEELISFKIESKRRLQVN